MFNKEQQIELIIERTIQNIVEKYGADKLKEKKLTFQQLKEELQQFYEQIRNDLLQNDRNLYELLESDRQLFNDFHKYLFEDYILNEIAITFSAGAIISTLVSLIGLTAMAKFKVVGRINDILKDIIHNIGKYITNKTDVIELSKFLYTNVPHECIKELRKVKVNSTNPDEAIKHVKQMGRFIVSGTNEKSLQRLRINEPGYINCILEFYIKALGISLMLFYKCLFDNKKFMDLIEIKKKPTEVLLHLDRTYGYKLFNTSSARCLKFYNDFKYLHENLIKLISVLYPGQTPETLNYYKKIEEAIKASSVYAQKLLDEGKNKRENKKETRQHRSRV